MIHLLEKSLPVFVFLFLSAVAAGAVLSVLGMIFAFVVGIGAYGRRKSGRFKDKDFGQGR